MTAVTLRAGANLVVNGDALVWGEIVVTERTDEVEEFLARGLVEELDEDGAAVPRKLSETPRKGCCGG